MAFAQLAAVLTEAMYSAVVSDDVLLIYDVAPPNLARVSELLGVPVDGNLYWHELIAHLGDQVRRERVPLSATCDQHIEAAVKRGKDYTTNGENSVTLKRQLQKLRDLLSVPHDQLAAGYQVPYQMIWIGGCLRNDLLANRFRSGWSIHEPMILQVRNPKREESLFLCECGECFRIE